MRKPVRQIFEENRVADRLDPDARRIMRLFESSSPPRRYPRRAGLSGAEVVRRALIALALLGVGLALIAHDLGR